MVVFCWSWTAPYPKTRAHTHTYTHTHTHTLSLPCSLDYDSAVKFVSGTLGTAVSFFLAKADQLYKGHGPYPSGVIQAVLEIMSLTVTLQRLHEHRMVEDGEQPPAQDSSTASLLRPCLFSLSLLLDVECETYQHLPVNYLEKFVQEGGAAQVFPELSAQQLAEMPVDSYQTYFSAVYLRLRALWLCTIVGRRRAVVHGHRAGLCVCVCVCACVCIGLLACVYWASRLLPA